MNIKIFVFAAAAMALTACSNEEESLGGAPVAVQVDAEICPNVTSRASGTSWAVNDMIGITATSAGKTNAVNVPYAYSESHFTAEHPIYFKDNEPVSFSAYYPYTETDKMESGKIAGNTSDQSKQADFDYLFASGAVASKSSPQVSFTGGSSFSHRMCRLSLFFLSGLGHYDLTGFTEYSLSGLVMDGTFDTADGTAAASSSAAPSDLVTMPNVAAGLDVYLSEVILYPQTVQGNTIALSVVMNGITYTADLVLPSATHNKLAAGYSINYTVFINNNKLEVSSGEIADWVDVSTGSGTANIVPMGNVTEKAQVRTGDYAMVDGSFVSKSATLTEIQKRNCVGIVFFTTAEARTTGITPAKLTDDKIMNTDFPDCTHGLIVALTYVSTGCRWQGLGSEDEGKNMEYYESIYTNFQNTSDTYSPSKSAYVAIESALGATDNINRILGYNNTKVLKAYNEYCSNNNKSDYIVKPVDELINWAKEHPVPKGATDWFLPSVKELYLLRHGDVDDVWNQVEKNFSTTNMFDGLLSSVNGDTFGTCRPWTSTERATKPTHVFIMQFGYTNCMNTQSKDSKRWVRAVCAF